MHNLFILFIFYKLILISTIGYGFLFIKIFSVSQRNINFGYIGLYGMFLSIFISYLSNLFVPHNYLFNSFYLIIGLLSFILSLKKEIIINFKKDLTLLIYLFLILFISLLIFKNHDDFPYYHFEYTYLLTQFDLLIGLGQFNHGFKTPSSIFYLNSLYYLPLIKFYSFNFAPIYILGFVNFIFFKKIKFFEQKKYYLENYLSFYSLLCLIFINIFFYRIAEHGTDRSAQILALLLIGEIIFCISLHKNKIDLYLPIYMLLAFIVSLKSFYILYLILLVPLYYHDLKLFKLKTFLKNHFYHKYIFVLFFVFLLSLSSYLFSTGCLIYPLKFTCIENLSWAMKFEQIDEMYIHYEKWAKSVTGVQFSLDNPNYYIQNFNWVSNWIEKYFFNKVSDFLLGLLVFIFIINLSFYKLSKQIQKISLNKYQIILFLLILILIIEWFINHPSLRYGGYNLIALFFILPSVLFLSSLKINIKKITKLSSVFILITIIIFSFRNIKRIDQEIRLYNYNPLKNAFYTTNEDHFNEYNDIVENIDKYKNNNTNIKKLFGKYVFLN